MQNRPVEPLALHLPAPAGDRDFLSARLEAGLPALAAARDGLLGQWQSTHEQYPLAAQQMLDEYHGSGRGIRHSRLGQTLARAKHLTDRVDAVVLVAGLDTCLAAQAVLASCAHPHHNELPRAERGGYPRVYFASGPPDNDALAALLDVIARRNATGIDGRWALISVPDDTPEAAIKTQVLAQALASGIGDECNRPNELLVELPGETSLSCLPFTPRVLLSAALAGIDVVDLLAGAAAACEQFISDRPQDCLALQLAGLSHLADSHRMQVWSQALEPVSRWYGRLRNRDLHRHQPAEKIAGRPLTVNVVAERLRRDRLDEKLSQVMHEARAAAIAAEQAAGRLSVELRLPRIDERSIGQLMQMMMLAVAVEARMIAARDPQPMHAKT